MTEKTKTQQEHERIKGCIHGIIEDQKAGLISHSLEAFYMSELNRYIGKEISLYELNELSFDVRF